MLFNNNSGAPSACGGVAVVTFTATSTNCRIRSKIQKKDKIKS